jgi:hypothetical protein
VLKKKTSKRGETDRPKIGRARSAFLMADDHPATLPNSMVIGAVRVEVLDLLNRQIMLRESGFRLAGDHGNGLAIFLYVEQNPNQFFVPRTHSCRRALSCLTQLRFSSQLITDPRS